MNNITNNFIKKISQDTLNGTLSWNTLFDYSHHVDLKSLSGYRQIIVNNEFHSFAYEKSYILITKDFVLVVLDELFKGMLDPIPVNEVNLYLSRDKYTPPYKLNLSEDIKSNLISAINSQNPINSYISPYEEIMVDYLSKS